MDGAAQADHSGRDEIAREGLIRSSRDSAFQNIKFECRGLAGCGAGWGRRCSEESEDRPIFR